MGIWHKLVCAAAAALLVLSLRVCTRGVGFTLFENDDWGRAFIRLEFPDYYDLSRTQAATLAIAERIRQDPDAESVLATPGRADAISGQASEGVYLAQIEVVYKPSEERPGRSINDILEGLRAMLRNEPDVIATVSMPSYVSGMSATVNYVLKGPDMGVLTARSQALQRLALSIPGLAQLDTGARDDKPEVRFLPDRAVMADMGLDAATVGTMVRANVDGIEAASYKEDLKTVDVRVKLAEREGAAEVGETPVPAAPGRPVPLSAFTKEVRTGQKVLIFRHDKERSIFFGGNERGGYAAGTIGNEMSALAEENGLVGDGYVLTPIGPSELLGESVADFLEAIILSVVLTLLTLAAILESWRKPFIVLTTIPMALIGVLWVLKVSGLTVSIFVLLGAVMLIGVVVNPAVLIVDKAAQLEKAGEGKAVAMCHAVAATFRAVVMVIIASGLGMLPIALSTGIGAVNRIGIGASDLTMNDAKVYFNMEDLESKVVPVVLRSDLKMQRQFDVYGLPTIDPAIVTIYGPKEVLDTIKSVKTNTVERLNVSESFSQTVPLDLLDGMIHANFDAVTVGVTVEKFTEADVSVPFLSPDSLTMRFFPDAMKVKCLVAIRDYPNLAPESFRVEFNHDQLMARQPLLDVQLAAWPQFVQVLSTSPDKVEYLIVQ